MDGLKGDQRMSVYVGLRAVCRWLLVSCYARGHVNATVWPFKNADLGHAEISSATKLAPCHKLSTAKKRLIFGSVSESLLARFALAGRLLMLWTNLLVIWILLWKLSFCQRSQICHAASKHEFSLCFKLSRQPEIITEAKSRADLGVKNKEYQGQVWSRGSHKVSKLAYSHPDAAWCLVSPFESGCFIKETKMGTNWSFAVEHL